MTTEYEKRKQDVEIAKRALDEARAKAGLSRSQSAWERVDKAADRVKSLERELAAMDPKSKKRATLSQAQLHFLRRARDAEMGLVVHGASESTMARRIEAAGLVRSSGYKRLDITEAGRIALASHNAKACAE